MDCIETTMAEQWIVKKQQQWLNNVFKETTTMAEQRI